MGSFKLKDSFFWLSIYLIYNAVHMGNHLACVHPTSSSLAPIHVLQAHTGRLSQLLEIANVADLMIDYSGQFVCHSNALHSGQRIPPLPADAELKMGELYVVLPMHKLHARLSPEEMAALSSLIQLSRPALRKRSHNKVHSEGPVLIQTLPPLQVAGTRSQVTALHHSCSSSLLPQDGTSQQLHWMACKSRSWAPRLDTINELACV